MAFNESVARAVEDLRRLESVQVLVCAPGDIQPEFIRYPKQGERCPVTNLPLNTLRDMIRRSKGKVVVRVIRRPGTTRGVKLIVRQSLIDYINTLPVADDDEDEDSNVGGES